MFSRFCLLALLALTACNVQVGPFVPRDPQPCASDWDCSPDYACRFPAINTRPVCLWSPGAGR